MIEIPIAIVLSVVITGVTTFIWTNKKWSFALTELYRTNIPSSLEKSVEELRILEDKKSTEVQSKNLRIEELEKSIATLNSHCLELEGSKQSLILLEERLTSLNEANISRTIDTIVEETIKRKIDIQSQEIQQQIANNSAKFLKNCLRGNFKSNKPLDDKSIAIIEDFFEKIGPKAFWEEVWKPMGLPNPQLQLPTKESISLEPITIEKHTGITNWLLDYEKQVLQQALNEDTYQLIKERITVESTKSHEKSCYRMAGDGLIWRSKMQFNREFDEASRNFNDNSEELIRYQGNRFDTYL
jgi:hypothetical protein